MTLRATNLVKHFGDVRALDGLSVEFAPHKITAVIGPNGAGKTTLIDALTGFLQVDRGRHFLGSVETTKLRPERIARLGVARTFQDVRLVWRESVLENVMVAIQSSAERLESALRWTTVRAEDRRIREKAIEALLIVELENYRETPAASLSYGQQKLLALARCIATGAQWLILDEPISGVALPLVESLLRIFRQLNDGGRSLLFIEHDIRAVRDVADVVVVIDGGRVIASGPARSVLDRAELLEAYVG